MNNIQGMIEPADKGSFSEKFPMMPFSIRHGLANNPMFTLPRIVDLVRQLPRDQIEFSSGNVAIGQKPDTVPLLDLSAEEVVRRIETCGAWMVLKRVDSLPAYRAIVEQALLSVARANGHTSLEDAGFDDIRGFLFVSSPNATTPFHIDSEDNFFVHIHGEKFFSVYDNRDGAMVSEIDAEQSIAKHRNVPYDAKFDAKSTCYRLQPGDGVFVPYQWPHWVRTGGSYSISLAITWKTEAVRRRNDIVVFNSMLRSIGLPQRAPGHQPMLDAMKLGLFRSARAVIAPLRRSEAMRRVLRSLALGRDANYYMKDTKKAA